MMLQGILLETVTKMMRIGRNMPLIMSGPVFITPLTTASNWILDEASPPNPHHTHRFFSLELSVFSMHFLLCVRTWDVQNPNLPSEWTKFETKPVHRTYKLEVQLLDYFELPTKLCLHEPIQNNPSFKNLNFSIYLIQVIEKLFSKHTL